MGWSRSVSESTARLRERHRDRFTYAPALSKRVPSRLFVTGLYGHTGATLPSPAALARELRTLLSVARALSVGGRVAEWVTGLR
jgi:hypothetical protein